MVTPVLGCSLLGVKSILLKVWPVVQIEVWIKNSGVVIFTNLGREEDMSISHLMSMYVISKSLLNKPVENCKMLTRKIDKVQC